jgi:hypothetical protein
VPNFAVTDPPYNQSYLPVTRIAFPRVDFDAEQVLESIQGLYDKRHEVEERLEAARKVLATRRLKSLTELSKMLGLVFPEPKPRPRRAAEEDII